MSALARCQEYRDSRRFDRTEHALTCGLTPHIPAGAVERERGGRRKQGEDHLEDDRTIAARETVVREAHSFAVGVFWHQRKLNEATVQVAEWVTRTGRVTRRHACDPMEYGGSLVTVCGREVPPHSGISLVAVAECDPSQHMFGHMHDCCVRCGLGRWEMNRISGMMRSAGWHPAEPECVPANCLLCREQLLIRYRARAEAKLREKQFATYRNLVDRVYPSPFVIATSFLG